MDILTSSISFKPLFSLPFSSTSLLTRKTPYKFNKNHLKSFTNPPFSTSSLLKIRRNSHIFARFGGPTKRRNSLRKKLQGESGPQVRQNPQKFTDPIHQFVDNQVSDSNISSNDSSLEKGSFELGEKRIDFDDSDKFGEKSIILDNSGKFGENVLWDKLGGWVEQYKKDIEFWGIGSNPIFTVFQDSSGNVERVLVDEDEILRRSGFEPLRFREESVVEEIDEVNSKVSYAKSLAEELEGGRNVIPRHSSVTKFVGSNEKLGFVGMIRNVFVPGKSLVKVSRVGIAVFCGFVLVWLVKKVCSMGAKEVELTGLEKEMLRRKMKSRMAKEKLQMGSVEVVEDPVERPIVVTERPRIDKEEVLNMIRGAKGSVDSLVVLDGSGARDSEFINMDSKIKEIQLMAKNARMIERGRESLSERDGLDEDILKKIDSEEKAIFEKPENLSLVDELEDEAINAPPSVGKDDTEEVARNMNFFNRSKMEILGNLEMQSSNAKFTNGDVEPLRTSSGRVIDDEKSHINGVTQSCDMSVSSNMSEDVQPYISSSPLNSPKKTPTRRKPRIIRSVKEAREYLSKKHEVDDVSTSAILSLGEIESVPESSDVEMIPPSEEASQLKIIEQNGLLPTGTIEVVIETDGDLNQMRPDDHFPCAQETMKSNEMFKLSDSQEKSDILSGENDFGDASKEENHPIFTKQCVEKVDKFDDTCKPTILSEKSILGSSRNASEVVSNATEELVFTRQSAFHDTNPHVNDTFQIDRVNGALKPSELGEIFPATFESNLAGPGPKDKEVHPITIRDEGDYCENEVKHEFLTGETFEGHENGVDDSEKGLINDNERWLEKNFHEVEPIVKKIGIGFRNSYNVAREKIKDVSQKWDLMELSSVKDDTELEWMQDDKLREIVFKVRENELAGRDPFHSMDPKDKVAFFEGLESKVEQENEKLSSLHEWLHSNIENIDYGADGISLYDPPEKVIPRWKGPPLDTISEFLSSSKNQQVESSLHKANETKKHDSVETNPDVSTSKSSRKAKKANLPRTVIEASDGSIKPGKKSGKEFWQHTKKWSRGFVESYNAETDPEVKSVMKDIGKDLDRWITEKEIQEAADLMDKFPQQKRIMEKKLNKLKREMELFGPQAVVSKYREYAEDKEVDYLWWLDLPHVLCIELYTYEGKEQRVGFYSLEMAEDLELEPKPRHVIAFQDPGDCKNFCYIIQAHLEMLGKGKAFIVPQPPKDVFQQAKGNGFGVTVIRKGELKLNVDQPLEEVEELITEIGSKMYHDKLMRERSVDISALMKGVFGVSPPSNRRKRKKRARKRPSKS